MDDDELRYLASEQVMVANAICCLSLGVGTALSDLWIWPPLIALGLASLVASRAVAPGRRHALRLASLFAWASVSVWCALLILPRPGVEPALILIALSGATSAGWAARFLREQTVWTDPIVRQDRRPAADAPADPYAWGIIEELRPS